MKVVCQYNVDLQRFLKGVVDLCIAKYGEGLHLKGLREIELKNKSVFDYEKDGMICENGEKIVLSSRLYEMLPTLDIEKIISNDKFKLLIYSLYHEMCHVSDFEVYPHLYYKAVHTQNKWDALAMIFWLEYLVEKRCYQRLGVIKCELYEQFQSEKLCCNKFDSTTGNVSNFFYFTKCISYLVAKIMWEEETEEYLQQTRDGLLKEYVVKLIEEISKLEKQGFFDDENKLSQLVLIMKRYYEKSLHAYEMQTDS